MVLRSGIIIPFQFRDNKKLLMIGVPEENRNLNIWDLRNVVRAAFGIYNFEFRNKKIGFNIPDELLLHYLAQRHDLTNFVIEIGQANLCEVSQNNGMMHSPSAESFMASDGTIRLHENDHILNVNRQECGYLFDNKQLKYPKVIKVCDAQSILSNDYETLKKDRAHQECSEQVSRSELQSITDERTDPKTEQSECEFERQYEMKVDDDQDEQSHNPHLNLETRLIDVNPKKVNYQQHPFEMNRFRRRGERISKDQKEVYVKYFEENPCMLAQRRNDSVLEPHWIKLAAILNNVPQGGHPEIVHTK